MIRIGDKEFRNIVEQVEKNKNDIKTMLQGEAVLSEFGIKVIGEEASLADLPSVSEYKEANSNWAYGDAYAIGEEAPYELYILTRANGTHESDYWFNIGEFPMPGPQGEQGEQGEQGIQGETGAQGVQGVQGAQGIPGQSIFSVSSNISTTINDYTQLAISVFVTSMTPKVNDMVVSANSMIGIITSIVETNLIIKTIGSIKGETGAASNDKGTYLTHVQPTLDSSIYTLSSGNIDNISPDNIPVKVNDIIIYIDGNDQPTSVYIVDSISGTTLTLSKQGDYAKSKQLYRHNVSLKSNVGGDSSFVIFCIINDSGEEVNSVDKARTILYNAGFLVNTNESPLGNLYKYCVCSGYSTNNSKYVTGVASRSGANGFVLLEDTTYEAITSLTAISDNVKAL